MMQTHRGGCHCGAVRYEADVDLAQGTLRCNCSICAKARAWFTFVAAPRFRLLKGEDALADYQWTPPNRQHPNLHYRFCKTCGVRVFAAGKNPKGEDIRALSVSTVEDGDADELAKSIKYVDGRHDRFDRQPEDIRLL